MIKAVNMMKDRWSKMADVDMEIAHSMYRWKQLIDNPPFDVDSTDLDIDNTEINYISDQE